MSVILFGTVSGVRESCWAGPISQLRYKIGTIVRNAQKIIWFDVQIFISRTARCDFRTQSFNLIGYFVV